MDHEFPTGWPEGSDFTGNSCWMEGRNPQNRVDFKTEPEGNLMCSPQALPPMAVNKGQGKAPLCKVCGDESSGFHYGVDSCEGCKGFFRRCITQGMTHKCANEEKCEITPFTRNSCQYCRLKKCFAVGMSREASRLGRRPKRLKESGGDSSKSHSSNLPIAPYPSQAELYRMRMAELQKLLQANGTFKSELMQAFLSAAQASFREHAKHSNSGPGQQHQQVGGNQGPYMDPMATNGNQNMPMDFLGQGQGQFGGAMHPAESGYSSLSSPPDTKMQTALLDPQASLSDMPASFLDGSDALYGNLPGNLNGSGSNLASPTSTTNFGSSGLYTPDPFNQVKVKTEPGLDSPGGQCSFASSSISSSAALSSSPVASTSTGVPSASSSTPSPSTSSTPGSRLGPMTPQQRTATPDSSQPECNIDARKILEDVKMTMSETRRQLIDQVTTAVVEAHLTTCMNTYQCIDKLQDERYDADVALADKTTEEKAVVMWQLFLSSMCPEITMVVTFCKRLPGFSDIDQEDQIRLIKQGSFEVLLARYCMLVNAVTETMMDPTHKYRFNRDVVLAMPMGTFFRQFYNIASCFNPLKLQDGEIGLFTAVLIVCPERENLKNKRAISKIQFLFMQALYFLIRKNHPDYDEHFMGLLNTIKVFRNINNEHFKALNDIKMTRPNNYTQFHALHHEVFDGKV